MKASQHPVLDSHRRSLRMAFQEWLLSQHPRTLVDLGAGDGSLVESLVAEGVQARGVEQPGPELDRAQELGRPVEARLLDEWSVAAHSATWITVRHVLHHLPDPARVLLRAGSVACTGLLVAEPISTTGLPMHAWTQRLEALTRRLDRENGMFHGPDLTPSELVGMLPASWRVEVRIHAPMTPLPPEEAEALIQAAARGKALREDDLEEADQIVEAARAGRLAPSGSVMVMARS